MESKEQLQYRKLVMTPVETLIPSPPTISAHENMRVSAEDAHLQ